MNMKYKIVTAVLGTLFVSSLASAGLFLNNDIACESRDVICSSVTGQGVGCNSFGISVECRSIVGSADFNGDGFQDCVVGAETGQDGDAQQITILNNNGGNSTCGVGSGRFATAEDHQLNGRLSATNTTLTNVVAGPLNAGVTDIVFAQTSADLAGNSFVQLLNPTEAYGADEAVLNTTDVNWGTANGQIATGSFDGQRALRLLNCNADGNLDAVVVAESRPVQTEPEVRINLLKNNGSGLQNAADSFLVTTFENSGSKTLAVADFDGDGDTDVAVAVGDSETEGSSKIVLCRNDGNCAYTCDAPIILNQTQENPLPTSIAAGDFDGDGDKDLAITTPGYTQGNAGVAYFLNNGSGTFTPGPRVAFNSTQPQNASISPFALAEGCFNNDKTEDLAVTNRVLPNPGLVATVPANSGDIKVVALTTALAPTVTNLAYNATNIVHFNFGIDAGNFHDRIGGTYTNGDDIMAVGGEVVQNQPESQRAYIFMNTPEVLTANAGVDRVTDVNVSISLPGQCLLTPSDPSDVITSEWSIVGINAVNTSIQNPNSLNPTFTATQPGTYTVRLRCLTTCDRVIAEDTVNIVVNPKTLPPPVAISTSGGCVANTLGEGLGLNQWSLVGFLMMILPIAAFRKMKARRLNF